ncbi:MAG: 1-deoxy-D-xylulose-5-phosphate reductoisomerase [Bacteroidales bacterium]
MTSEISPRRIAILGSTGSIGRQALEVIDAHPGRFTAEVLTANRNYEELVRQAEKYRPNAVVIAGEEHYQNVRSALDQLDIKVWCGADAVSDVVSMESVDMVLVALVGFAALRPAVEAISNRKPVALANKECLVVAGSLITRLVQERKVPVIPVDSEHSAIYQCLAGEPAGSVEKLILTASGGPFLGLTVEEMQQVTVEEALSHPNWQMGPKITIDSATMMNKGLEVIEARWLFGIEPEKIEVLVHPQSVVHSLVQFRDGSVKAQLGVPDMRLPIQYALSYPERLQSNWPRLDLTTSGNLSFSKPDTGKFRNLALAYEAIEKGGNIPCVLNAANEVAVDMFLRGRLPFGKIPDLIETCIQGADFIQAPDLDELIACDRVSRIRAMEWIKSSGGGKTFPAL